MVAEGATGGCAGDVAGPVEPVHALAKRATASAVNGET